MIYLTFPTKDYFTSCFAASSTNINWMMPSNLAVPQEKCGAELSQKQCICTNKVKMIIA